MDNMFKVVAVEDDGKVNNHYYPTLKTAINAADAISEFFSDAVEVFDKEGKRVHY